MTEKEAETKWCPMFTLICSKQNQVERTRHNCIASECMMWRWNIDEGDGRHGTRGFCGVGGKT
jgi:hypothetical protein